MTDQERLLTDEEIKEILGSFWDKYAGSGLSPSEVRELHFNELYNLFFEVGKKEGMRELAEWVNAHIGLWDKKWIAKMKEINDLSLQS